MKSSSHMSILVSQLLKKKEAPRVDESQARTRASLLKKNKASNEKNPFRPGGFSRREGPRAEGHIVFENSRTWEQCV